MCCASDYLINIWGLRPDLRVVSSIDAGGTAAPGRRRADDTRRRADLLEELPAGGDAGVHPSAPIGLLLTPDAPIQARPWCV